MAELTHWKKLHNPDYIGAYALEPGQDLTVTIKSVAVETVTGADGKKEQCMVARFMGDTKPMIVNTTNSKMISKVLKTPYIEQWQGKSIQLYSASIKAFGEQVDALRVRPFAPTASNTSQIQQKAPENSVLVCTVCNNTILDTATRTAQQIADGTKKETGVIKCLDCFKAGQNEGAAQ